MASQTKEYTERHELLGLKEKDKIEKGSITARLLLDKTDSLIPI